MIKETTKPPIITLRDAYKVSGFRVRAKVESHDEECTAFVLTLERRSKKQCVVTAGRLTAAIMTNDGVGPAILDAAGKKFISTFRCVASSAISAA